MHDKKIGKKIKELLNNHGIRQIDLCNALQYSPSRLSNYLNSSREPDIYELARIASYFDVPLDYFNPIESCNAYKDKTKNTNFINYLSSLNEAVKVEIVTDMGIKRLTIHGSKISKLITENTVEL